MSHSLRALNISMVFIAFLISGNIARAAADSAPPASSPELIQKGKTLFVGQCLSCHGEKGDGKGPAAEFMNPRPRNFVTDKFKHGQTPQNVFDSLTKGIHGTTMPSFSKLSSEERWALAYYVLSLRK